MEQSLFDQAWNQAVASLQSNQLLSGGLVLGSLGFLVAYLKSFPNRLWTWFLYYCTVTLELHSGDPAYNKIFYWLNSLPYTKKTRRLSLKFIETPQGWRVILGPARGEHIFWWGSRLVWMSRNEEADKGAGNNQGGIMAPRETIEIRMVGRDQECIRKLVDEALEAYEKNNTWKFTIYDFDHQWKAEYTDDVPRDLKTIILPDDGVEMLADMERFLKNRKWYQDRGIPYHRGYLFYGPPGTGKSCTAAAIAAHLKLDLYPLNMGTISTDDGMERAITGIYTGDRAGMLLLEDIDTAVPSDNRDFDKEKHRFSLGTLLNCLDGVKAADNLIVVMTTNRKDSLDSALLRPGRIDKQVEFHLANQRQIEESCKVFFPDRWAEVLRDLKVPEGASMATVQEILREIAFKNGDDQLVEGVEVVRNIIPSYAAKYGRGQATSTPR